MVSELIERVTNKYKKTSIPKIKVGQTVEVSTIIREGDKSRIQVFKGLVIAIKGSGVSKTFTVRKISYGVGVEKIFPLHSPNIADIKIITEEKVRRSKLYFMRDRVGKMSTRVKKGNMLVYENNEETMGKSENIE
ncbi:MAG: 50S ribosomal protein L19 [Candidatus Dojkabacteria bacterium]|nr:50S ribosomal protein L19 [Candidatus Dojkabacteria bacterium]